MDEKLPKIHNPTIFDIIGDKKTASGDKRFYKKFLFA